MLQNFKQTDLRRDSVSHVQSALQVAARARSERQKACAKVGTVNRAVGVVVSHPLSMREALGSIPRLSTFAATLEDCGARTESAQAVYLRAENRHLWDSNPRGETPSA